MHYAYMYRKVISVCFKNVTGPVKTGHVVTNYTLSHITGHISVVNLYSVTYSI